MRRSVIDIQGNLAARVAGALAFVSALRVSAFALPYNATQIEVPDATVPTTTVNLGLDQGDVAWGDMNNDGLLDAVASGRNNADATNAQLLVYINNGGAASTFTGLNVDGAGGGLRNSRLVLGDVNGDGRLDIVVVGLLGGAGTNVRLRTYLNNGGASPTFTRVEVDTTDGLQNGGVDLGDFDNDGDLDILVTGADSAGTPRLRVWRNLGGGVFDPNQFDVDAVNGGLSQGDCVFGDLDNDGFLDVLATGIDTGGTRQFRVYWNNKNGAFAAAQNVDGAGGGLSDGSITLGDYNNDGNLDILINGTGNGTNRRLRIYTNNGNRNINAAQIEVDGANGGLRNGRAVWGDTDRDGDLDILVNGVSNNAGSADQLRVYTNNGNGTFNATQTDIDGNNNGLSNGGVAWGDFDNDGDLDILVSGTDTTNPQLRVYINTNATANPAPTAPTTLVSTFTFSTTGVSTATFKWNPGTDTGANPTPINVRNYDLQISTLAGVAVPYVFPGEQGASPRLGSYLRPPQIFDGNANHGVMLVSTAAWQKNGAAYGLRTDTSYYYQVRTIDAGLQLSGWSGAGTLWTGVAPGTSTISVTTRTLNDQAVLSWTSAGDDDVHNSLTGAYIIQYSTNPATAWNPLSTPAGAVTMSVSTTSQAPGAAESTATVSFLTEGASTYFRLWSQDDVGMVSAISNQTTTYIPIAVRDVVLSTGVYNFGNVSLGLSTQTTAAITVTYTGTANSTFRLYASTITPGGSPWSLAAAPGPDQVRLYAGFNAAQPALGAFGAEDVVLTGSQACTATAFAVGQTCLGLPTGSVRTLWFRLDMPTTSSDATAGEQRLQVTVEAGPP